MILIIEQVSEKIALKIKETSPNDTASVEVMKYALVGILHNAVIMAVSLLAGLVLGKFWEVLLASAAFMILRLFSGGYHFKTPLSCFIVTTAIFISVPWIPLMEDAYLLYLNTISLLLILVFAPSNIREHIRVPEKYFFVFKVVSLLIAATGYLFNHSVITWAFLAQSLTLIHLKKEVKTNG